jgi:hypothetical protein
MNANSMELYRMLATGKIWGVKTLVRRFLFSGENCRKNLIFSIQSQNQKRARVSQGKHLKQAQRPLLEIPKKFKWPLVQ